MAHQAEQQENPDAMDDLQTFARLNQNGVERRDRLILGYWINTLGKPVCALRTELMWAAQQGDFVTAERICLQGNVDINFQCGAVRSSALHCAAMSDSPNAVRMIQMLLHFEADKNLVDANGCRPIDVVYAPRSRDRRIEVEKLLRSQWSSEIFSTTSASLEDEFMMHSFKVRFCGLGRPHNWKECAYLHPGENARRRDPEKYRYTYLKCAYDEKTCFRKDLCPYAHCLFEHGFHPQYYKTVCCSKFPHCTDHHACFFAHSEEEQRSVMDLETSNVHDCDIAMLLSEIECMSWSWFSELASAYEDYVGPDVGWIEERVLDGEEN